MPIIILPVNDEIIASYMNLECKPEKIWDELLTKISNLLVSSDYCCLHRCIKLQVMSVDKHNGYQFGEKIGPFICFDLPQFALDFFRETVYNAISSIEEDYIVRTI